MEMMLPGVKNGYVNFIFCEKGHFSANKKTIVQIKAQTILDFLVLNTKDFIGGSLMYLLFLLFNWCCQFFPHRKGFCSNGKLEVFFPFGMYQIGSS